jgi:hypothetical protein
VQTQLLRLGYRIFALRHCDNHLNQSEFTSRHL